MGLFVEMLAIDLSPIQITAVNCYSGLSELDATAA
jgi:hypothetical protein